MICFFRLDDPYALAGKMLLPTSGTPPVPTTFLQYFRPFYFRQGSPFQRTGELGECVSTVGMLQVHVFRHRHPSHWPSISRFIGPYHPCGAATDKRKGLEGRLPSSIMAQLFSTPLLVVERRRGQAVGIASPITSPSSPM